MFSPLFLLVKLTERFSSIQGMLWEGWQWALNDCLRVTSQGRDCLMHHEGDIRL